MRIDLRDSHNALMSDHGPPRHHSRTLLHWWRGTIFQGGHPSMPPLDLEQCESRIAELARYIGTSNWHHVENEVNRLLDRWLLLNRDPARAEWDCEPR